VWAGLRAHAGERGGGPGQFTGCRKRRKGKAGRGKWAAREEREREGGLGFFFLNSFQIHFSNFQTAIKQKTMHSNHDAQSLIISNFI
jgi:hypothetical protein